MNGVCLSVQDARRFPTAHANAKLITGLFTSKHAQNLQNLPKLLLLMLNIKFDLFLLSVDLKPLINALDYELENVKKSN